MEQAILKALFRSAEISRNIYGPNPAAHPEIRQKISEMKKTLQESIKAVRDLSYDLRPPVLDEMGLVETIEIHILWSEFSPVCRFFLSLPR